MFTNCAFSLQKFWLATFSSSFIFKDEDERKHCFSDIPHLSFCSLFLLRGVFLFPSLLQTHVPNGIMTLFLRFESSHKQPKQQDDGFYSAPRLYINYTDEHFPMPKKKKRVPQCGTVLSSTGVLKFLQTHKLASAYTKPPYHHFLPWGNTSSQGSKCWSSHVYPSFLHLLSVHLLFPCPSTHPHNITQFSSWSLRWTKKMSRTEPPPQPHTNLSEQVPLS